MHQFKMTVGPAAMSELCGSFENLAVYLSFQCQSQLGDVLVDCCETIRNRLLLLKLLSWLYNIAAMHIICQDFLYMEILSHRSKNNDSSNYLLGFAVQSIP